MSRSIPIRDAAGNIIAMQQEAEAQDAVQATMAASLQAVGATANTEPRREAGTKPQPPPLPSLLRIALSAAGVCVWVAGLVLLSAQTQHPSRMLPTVVATQTAASAPAPTLTATAAPAPTTVPPATIAEPTPGAAFSPPPPAPAPLTFCADQRTLWGETHQCAATQAEADALADAEIGKVNANGQATATALKATATR
jgi:hypothetical protein